MFGRIFPLYLLLGFCFLLGAHQNTRQQSEHRKGSSCTKKATHKSRTPSFSKSSSAARSRRSFRISHCRKKKINTSKEGKRTRRIRKFQPIKVTANQRNSVVGTTN